MLPVRQAPPARRPAADQLHPASILPVSVTFCPPPYCVSAYVAPLHGNVDRDAIWQGRNVTGTCRIGAGCRGCRPTRFVYVPFTDHLSRTAPRDVHPPVCLCTGARAGPLRCATTALRRASSLGASPSPPHLTPPTPITCSCSLPPLPPTHTHTFRVHRSSPSTSSWCTLPALAARRRAR